MQIILKGLSIIGTESLVICQVFVGIPVSSNHYYFPEKKISVGLVEKFSVLNLT